MPRCDLDVADEWTRSKCPGLVVGVHLLNDAEVTIDEVSFLGTTGYALKDTSKPEWSRRDVR